MYTHIWNKYLPIIRILLKKSQHGDQTLTLNVTDFERSATTKKGLFTFNIEFHKGRLYNAVTRSLVAKSLAIVLLEDKVVKELFLQKDYQLSMDSKFRLTMKCLTPKQESKPVEESNEA